ncbi:hypothetical protein [Fodinicola feengrottensis]|uniref:hypothetical protein n=1 Tax=Fodinicola feengrottensis TaxID=435914 RepID=UPI002441EACC|nr:hypothetical protein [Fodinicola feengrottensis]
MTEQGPVRQAVADNAHRGPEGGREGYNHLLQELKETRRWRGWVMAAQKRRGSRWAGCCCAPSPPPG